LVAGGLDGGDGEVFGVAVAFGAGEAGFDGFATAVLV